MVSTIKESVLNKAKEAEERSSPVKSRGNTMKSGRSTAALKDTTNFADFSKNFTNTGSF